MDKTRRRQVSSIRPCIRCNVCHIRLFQTRLVKCTVNPFLSWGGEQKSVGKAREAKKVAVVGGGPAGIQAALTAADRGHEVILYERQERPGGNLIPASVPDFKEDLRMLLDYYEQELNKTEVEVRLGVDASPTMILDGGFDSAILALGAEHIIPEVAGIENERVRTASEIFDPENMRDTGGDVVVLGAGHVGCEAAWYLSLKGKSVKLVDIIPVDSILADEHLTNRDTLLHNLEKQGVEILGNRTLREVSDENVIFKDKNGTVESYHADNLVIAIGFKPRDGFRRAFSDHMPDYDIYEVGDCARPGRLYEAIHGAKHMAEKL